MKHAIKKEIEVLAEEVDETVTPSEPVVETVEVDEEVFGDSVSVCSKNGVTVRVYSKELHGKSFKKLAEEFASKRGLTVK